jgi:radical SAM protein with 4Fe4S-binding SPASM domain
MSFLVEKVDKKFIVFDSFSRNMVCSSSKMFGVEQINKQNIRAFFKNYLAYLCYVKEINYISTLYYNITYRCFLNCPYCYANKNNLEVSLRDNLIILSKLKMYNVRNIVLIGGEPFYHPNILDLLKQLQLFNFKSISIVTNGIIFNERLYRFIKENSISLQISIDSNIESVNARTRGKGNLKKVLKNISILQKMKIDYSVMGVLTSDNINMAKNFYNFFYKQNIKCGFFVVKKVDDHLRVDNTKLNDLYNHILKIHKNANQVFDCVKSSDQMQFNKTGYPIAHCGAGIVSISIDPNGKVFPCVKTNRNKREICNIIKDYNHFKKFNKNKQFVIDNEFVNNIKKCKGCKIKYFCGGGCREDEEYIIKKNTNYSQCNLQKFNFKYYVENYKG